MKAARISTRVASEATVSTTVSQQVGFENVDNPNLQRTIEISAICLRRRKDDLMTYASNVRILYQFLQMLRAERNIHGATQHDGDGRKGPKTRSPRLPRRIRGSCRYVEQPHLYVYYIDRKSVRLAPSPQHVGCVVSHKILK